MQGLTVALLRTAQNTVFFIFVVDTFPIFAALCAEIEVAMEIENEHLTEIPHLCVLCVRRKGGEVFGLDTIALNREGVHQHGTEAPFVGIVTKTDMMVELAVLQRFAYWQDRYLQYRKAANKHVGRANAKFLDTTSDKFYSTLRGFIIASISTQLKARQ